MCELFINADPNLWGSRTKSLRIDGVATSIRIEGFFWQVLEDIATRDDMTVNQLITRLYFEAMDADHDLGNFTSFLRVCAGRYLALQAAGEISRDMSEPLRDVNARAILDRESVTNAARRAVSGRKDLCLGAAPPRRTVN